MKKKPPEKPESTQIQEIGGKTLEQWIKEIHSSDRSKGENAIRTVMMFGPDRAYQAVPALINELNKHRPGYPLDTSIRVNATIALGFILGGANDPDPKLVKEAVYLLTRLLNDGQSIVKYRAAQALGRFGPEAKSAIPNLLYAIKDVNTWETRQAAATALGHIALDRESKIGPPLDVLNALFRALSDSSSQVRLAAIQSLTWVGGPANPNQRAQLLKNLAFVAKGDAEPTVRVWGNMAIMSISHKIEIDHLAPIGAMLKNHELAARVQAAQALGTIGPKAKSQVKALIGGLSDAEPSVIFWSMWALSRMEKWAEPALPTLQQIVADPKKPEPLKKAAESCMDAIQGKDKKKTTPKSE